MNPRVQLLEGPQALEESRDLWLRLEEAADPPVFQTYAWAENWVQHVSQGGEPWVLVASESPGAVWPLFLRRRPGSSILGLLGEGVSDYLGPLGLDASGTVLEAFAAQLHAEGPRFDLLDFRSLALGDPERTILRRGLERPVHERLYESCPAIDTTGSWTDYLTTRKKKFRANLKRAERRVSAHGALRVRVEDAAPRLLDELDDVERESWKWEAGTAYFQSRARRAFLRAVLLDPRIRSEVWTCRVEDELAGFAVVFPSRSRRCYYLPSFRGRFSDVGTYLLAQIVRASCESDCREVDLLQGDESYKVAWSTHQHAVVEVASPGATLAASAHALALRARWRLAGSPRVRRLRGAMRGWQARLADPRGG